MKTLFPREEHAEVLFRKIQEDAEACRIVTMTFYEAVALEQETYEESLSSEQFVEALFQAYENQDLTAFLMAICKNSMFDLLRNAEVIPFRLNADGVLNPFIVTNEEGDLVKDGKIVVGEKEFKRFRKIFQKEKKKNLYLAYGYRKHHCYDPATMTVENYPVEMRGGILLVYALPNTLEQNKTEAEAYADFWETMKLLKKNFAKAIVYYGQGMLKKQDASFDELGIFFPLHQFMETLERDIKKADEIMRTIMV